MQDIFISYSSKDEKIANEIVDFFTDAGYKCWISCSYDNINCGDNYLAKIVDAIRSSRVFVLLLSKNSAESPQVHHEVAMANDNAVYGLSIVPIVLDDSFKQNYYNKNIDYVLAGNQAISWNENSKKHLVEKISELLDFELTNANAQIHSSDFSHSFFCGRENEIIEITNSLKKYKRVCLYGIGGIGKTAIAEAIGLRETENSTVVYARVEKGIIGILSDDDKVKISADGIDEVKRNRSDYEYSICKFKLLSENLKEDDLIILDNVNLDDDIFVDRILTFKCRVLLTSRTKSKRNIKVKYINVTEIKDDSALHQIFYNYYRNELPVDEKRNLDRLFELSNNNTLSIVLLGQQMNYWEEVPSDYLKDDRFSITRKHLNNSGNSAELRDTYNMIADLIDVSMLNRNESIVLKTMTLLPITGYSRIGFAEIIGDKYLKTISDLESQGWICQNDKRQIYLHPIVREIIMSEYDLKFDDADLRAFTDGFINLIKNSWNESFDDNIAKKDLVLSVYHSFPEPNKYTYKEYLIISKYLWVINCIDESLKIQNRIKHLFIGPNGKHEKSVDEAEAALQIGFTLHGKGMYEEAVGEFNRAAGIFGNKYGASLSHMAQTRMYAEPECDLESIEWMLSDSLDIRKRFMANSPNEAASNHLYAKVLSNFGTKLDDAIKMERAALKFFSKQDPEGVNVSSAKYILGWLYVLTAEDDDDIEFGIEYIEAAKKIRLKHRGDELHPWMEDIYKKLGLSYFKLKDYDKSYEYFVLLEKVQNQKFSNNKYADELIETYKNLVLVCESLGKDDERKKYKKLIRKYS